MGMGDGKAANCAEECGDPEVCPGCGKAFRCGMNAGQEPCWCAALPPLLAVPEAGAARCYCPSCLQSLLAARDDAAS